MSDVPTDTPELRTFHQERVPVEDQLYAFGTPDYLSVVWPTEVKDLGGLGVTCSGMQINFIDRSERESFRFDTNGNTRELSVNEIESFKSKIVLVSNDDDLVWAAAEYIVWQRQLERRTILRTPTKRTTLEETEELKQLWCR